jgi:nucleotide-binding universal stress UspA family protein
VAYKDILVYLDPTSGAEERLRLAVELARAHGARLIGADVSSDEAFLGASAERALQIRPRFAAAAREAGLSGQFIGQDDVHAPPLSGYAHCVDLLIASRPEREEKALVRAFVPEGALTSAGAPMLIIPQGWIYGPVGANVVIAWNDSREAIRAVHDAMPLLRKASKVTIFSFSSRLNGLRASAEHLADHLLRHEVTARISDWTNTGDMSAIEALFASLDTQDADMIVAGAFGHSRVFEGLFGGLSLDLLRQPLLPVFMSH